MSESSERTNRLFSIPQYLLDRLAEEAGEQERSGNAQLIQILKDRYGEEKVEAVPHARTRKNTRRETATA